MLPTSYYSAIIQFSQPLLLTTLSFTSFGLALFLTPSIQPINFSIHWITPAQAQTFNDEQIKSYASALIEIESLRQSILKEMAGKIGETTIPGLRCDDPKFLDAFPTSARGVAKKYCDLSKEIVEEKYKLTPELFNKITIELSRDQGLKGRIQDAMRRLSSERKP